MQMTLVEVPQVSDYQVQISLTKESLFTPIYSGTSDKGPSENGTSTRETQYKITSLQKYSVV